MAVNLSPVGGVASQFFTNTGSVLTGGKLYTYLAGTTTPATTYTTSAGNVPRSNPILLDAAGRVSSGGEIWITANLVYKFLLTDSNDVLIGTYDNISTQVNTDASSVTYTPAGSGAVTTTVQSKLREFVSVKDFGAVGNGVDNDTSAIQAAFAVSSKVSFPSGSYLITSNVTTQDDNVEIDFGNATIINGGAQWTFSLGTRSNTPQNTGLKITGGYFTQLNPSTTSDLNYIRLQGFSNFVITGCNMKNVSNGGIYIEAGCENGLIDGVTINGASGYSTNRGIWLAGDTATDYASQLVDISSITRNATALPVYAVKNVRITNCSLVLPAYAIYVDNSRDAHIENCYIDISGSGLRCVALNSYSPGSLIKGNTFKGDQASTGILVTQFSHDVIIEGNAFLGTFGGGRDIYVAYLSDCQITDNRFNTNSTQQILIDMGATAVIRSNYFNRTSGVTPSGRCVLFTTIDEAVAGTGTYGNTATTLAGITFANNVVKNRLSVVNTKALTATNGNIPGLDVVNVRDSIFYNFNEATTSDEYGLRITAPGTTYTISYSYFNNTVYPAANAARNSASVTGTGVVAIRTDVQMATFRCVSPLGNGVITSTKLYGGYFSCNGVSTGGPTDIVTISPRSLDGGFGATVSTPLEIVDVLGIFASYDMTRSGTNFNIRFYNSSGVIIDLDTTSVTFDVVIVDTAT